ncbi:MAG: hypothetical protein AAB492_02955 [Patescibacteria group bacterium]
MTNRLLAQITNPVLPGNLGQGGQEAGSSAIGAVLGAIIGAIIIMCFMVAFLYLLLGGFDWITSGGDKTKLTSARDKITNALIGLIIVGTVWAITVLVGQFVGIDFPNIPIPTVGS